MTPTDNPLLSAVSDILSDFEMADGSADPEHWSGPARDIFAVSKRKAWDNSVEPRCNFASRPRLSHRATVWFLSLWQKSVTGRTLSEIKADPLEIPHFAEAVSAFILDVLGNQLRSGLWCICTTPKRRHKVRNFATLVCMDIHERINIPFYEDVAFCDSRQRIGAVFSLNCLPQEPNIIVFDDFVTTGSTLKGMRDLLLKHGKNCLFLTGINNKL